jgi:hypothetical protein
VTPSPQTPEFHADRVLKSLKGYVVRQVWEPEDRAVIAGILREWADEVEALEARVLGLEQDLEKARTEADEWKNAAYSHRAS